jgi:hypothetical protein
VQLLRLNKTKDKKLICHIIASAVDPDFTDAIDLIATTLIDGMTYRYMNGGKVLRVGMLFVAMDREHAPKNAKQTFALQFFLFHSQKPTVCLYRKQ